VIEIGQELGWVEAILFMVYFAHSAGQVTVVSLLQGVRPVSLERRFGSCMGMVLLGQCGGARRAQHSKAAYFEKVTSGKGFHGCL
jgi:hypothetical protein